MFRFLWPGIVFPIGYVGNIYADVGNSERLKPAISARQEPEFC